MRPSWRRLLCVAVGSTLAACFPAEPTPFARGDEIPLGSWKVTVRSVEAISADLLPGVNQLAGNASAPRLLAVHVEIASRDESDDAAAELSASERRFAKLLTSFGLRDGQGQAYAFGLPLPEAQYQMAKMGNSFSLDDMEHWTPQLGRWVVVFAVPAASEDFTLRVRNLWPAEGQARLASVDLGR